MNVKLNAGGFLGALIGGLGSFAVFFLIAKGDAGVIGENTIWIIACLIIAALGGNALWPSVVGKKPEPKSRKKRDRSRYEVDE